MRTGIKRGERQEQYHFTIGNAASAKISDSALSPSNRHEIDQPGYTTSTRHMCSHSQDGHEPTKPCFCESRQDNHLSCTALHQGQHMKHTWICLTISQVEDKKSVWAHYEESWVKSDMWAFGLSVFRPCWRLQHLEKERHQLTCKGSYWGCFRKRSQLGTIFHFIKCKDCLHIFSMR